MLALGLGCAREEPKQQTGLAHRHGRSNTARIARLVTQLIVSYHPTPYDRVSYGLRSTPVAVCLYLAGQATTANANASRSANPSLPHATQTSKTPLTAQRATITFVLTIHTHLLLYNYRSCC